VLRLHPCAPNLQENLNVHGVFLHVLGDALGSVAVICRQAPNLTLFRSAVAPFVALPLGSQFADC
jgi:Co/Zn/Cd efflux system component